MLVIFVAALFANVGMGAVEIPPAQALAILLSHAGIDLDIQFEPRLDAVLWNIRMPRVVLGILVGGSLGVAGAALQGVFRNPLAEPGIIGVSSGAATGAVAPPSSSIWWPEPTAGQRSSPLSSRESP